MCDRRAPRTSRVAARGISCAQGLKAHTNSLEPWRGKQKGPLTWRKVLHKGTSSRWESSFERNKTSPCSSPPTHQRKVLGQELVQPEKVQVLPAAIGGALLQVVAGALPKVRRGGGVGCGTHAWQAQPHSVARHALNRQPRLCCPVRARIRVCCGGIRWWRCVLLRALGQQQRQQRVGA